MTQHAETKGSLIIDGFRVHNESVCMPPCPFHAPSDHPLKDAEMHIRGDKKGLVERICEHGIGHDDPDSVAYMHKIGERWAGIHGCDGCCDAADSGVLEKGFQKIFGKFQRVDETFLAKSATSDPIFPAKNVDNRDDELTGISGELPQPLENFEQLPDTQPKQDEQTTGYKVGALIIDLLNKHDASYVDGLPRGSKHMREAHSSFVALINSEAFALLERLEKQAIELPMSSGDNMQLIPASAVQQEKDAIIGKERV